MKRSIQLILVLMSLCVLGIVGLQLFWNYQNYQQTKKTFEHDVNEALARAVDGETAIRQEQIIRRFEGWLADTALIIITADHKNRYNNTVFHIRDTHPRFAEDKKRALSFGLTDFKQKLDQITPEAKRMLIHHFGESILRNDLKKGIVYHYTELLGDSLEKVYGASKADLNRLGRLFAAELGQKGIRAAFVLNPKQKENYFLTGPVDTHFRKPYKHDYLIAGLESPDSYFLKAMKWVIITSLLLIAITIACFVYTVKTLLSQEKLAALKQAFVSNMTHELNTPIASIKITAEALKTFRNEPQRQEEYLDIISYQADKLGALTAQILETNEQVQADQTSWNSFDLNKVITEAISDLQAQSLNAGARISFDPATPELQLQGDRLKWRNVMTNLIDNALKYSESSPTITITASAAGNLATVRVADNGIGIPTEYRQKVLDSFFRVPQGNRHDVKGYGLGLSYVRQVVEAHQGSIRIAANEPAGTCINIQIPLA